MTSAVSQDRLREFLRGTTASKTIEELVEASEVSSQGSEDLSSPESASGPQSMHAPDALTRTTLEKLDRGLPLDSRERYHLEAVIMPSKRPAIDIIGGDFSTRHPDWLHLNQPALKARLKANFPSIGRIELPTHPTLPYGGTGFAVGPNLLMTNRHVAEIFATGIGVAGLNFISGMEAGIDFLKERGRSETAYLTVRSVLMIHPHWDLALLAVEGLPATRRALKLSTLDPAAASGRQVAVIGYPTFDVRNPADVQNDVFAGVYGIKRLQPGVMTGNAPVGTYYERVVEAGLHNASTLGGDSGACVLDLDTGHVLGLHFGGRYADTNYCVPAGALASDGRVIDAGVTFSGPVSRRSTQWDDAWDRIAQEKLPAPKTLTSANGGFSMAANGGETRITIPLEITIRLGEPQHGDLPVTVSPPRAEMTTTERAMEPLHETDYTTRKGYDPAFLGVTVPMPAPRRPDELVRLENGDHEIRYHHFSVVLHKARRLALFTASNVSAYPARKKPGNRPASDYTRKGLGGLGEKDSEKWFGDPRIAGGEQLPDKFYNRDRQSFDKGHIVRREDVAWGDTYTEMQNANGDTFHVTNCTPQTARFNRPDEEADNWGALENLVLKSARTENVSVFAGPVLRADDLIFRGVDTEGEIAVKIPRTFWKVLVTHNAGLLQAFGFTLEQDLVGVDIELVLPHKWVKHMRPIQEIEDLAGVNFARKIREADQIGTSKAADIMATAGIAVTTAVAVEASSLEAPAGAEIVDIVAFWRDIQKHGKPSTDDIRFVVTLTAPISDDTIRSEVKRALDLDVEVKGLFESDPKLDRFRLIIVPSVVPTDRSDLFDVARYLNHLLGSETVEPDLATNYFDGNPIPPPEGTTESANFAFWCWVDETKAAPLSKNWALEKTKVREAWDYSASKGRPSGGKGILVFQPDTGVVPTHTEMPFDVDKDARSTNFVEPGRPPIDPMTGSGNIGHGTGTGSVVASPKAGAMSGTAPEATLIPIRAITSVAVIDQSRVAQAIDHARRNGAHVITMSLGGLFSSALAAAVRKAVDANIIVIAAAGNCVGTVVWPARYDEVIAVGGINEKLEPWKGSSAGEAVDISGPAELVLRADARDPVNPGKVAGGQGTSFATAHLAGVAACWLAYHGRNDLIAKLRPGTTLQSVFKATVQRSSTVPPGFDTDDYGAGIVNAEALLRRPPDFAGAPEAAAARSTADQVRDLLAETGAFGQFETVAPILADKQGLLEIAAMAMDRSRIGRVREGSLEALPPVRISRGLRIQLRPSLTRGGDKGGQQ
ncbi:S8 family serine peptidase [Rhizobium leguminosarum]|nr:S8 family serine peptidase [Rhizobium leguminosarum]MBY5863062.1 S8 family serine peptidase [Rhizobium leguminosarum]